MREQHLRDSFYDSSAVKLIVGNKGENYFPLMCLFDYFFSFNGAPRCSKILSPQVRKLLYGLARFRKWYTIGDSKPFCPLICPLILGLTEWIRKSANWVIILYQTPSSPHCAPSSPAHWSRCLKNVARVIVQSINPYGGGI